MRAERVGSDTLLAQIVRLVGEAQRSRAPVQRLVDRVARYFVPAVLAVSLLTFFLWWHFDPDRDDGVDACHRCAVAVLVIACPCALGLATPMAIMVGTGRGAESGVLIRDAEALEVLHQADTLVVDKTGTLTEGKPRLVVVEPANGFQSERSCCGWRPAWSAAANIRWRRPWSRVRRNAAWNWSRSEDFQSFTGKGVTGPRRGPAGVAGQRRLACRAWRRPSSRWQREPRSCGARGIPSCSSPSMAGSPGLLGVADPIRATTPEAIRLLHADGLRIIMLTGDNRTTAEAVARQLGIDEVIAEVLPAQKSAVMARLQDEGHIVAMAGDGINDAPALARAQVGIAMGSGTDVAMESAGVTLVRGDLRAIARARRLSRFTLSAIRQNLFLAFVYNAVSIPLAAVGIFNPILAGAAMSLSSVSVIANSLRLRKKSL